MQLDRFRFYKGFATVKITIFIAYKQNFAALNRYMVPIIGRCGCALQSDWLSTLVRYSSRPSYFHVME